MALIGKIREKSWLLIAVIGIAMLFFILGEFKSSFSGPQKDQTGIGTVNGNMVNQQLYETYVNNALNNILQRKMQQNPNQQPELTDQDRQNAKRQAWRTAILKMLMDKELQNIGLVVGEFELENVLYGQNGFEPSSISLQFKDTVTGEFAPEQFRKALEQLRTSTQPQQVQQYKNIMDFVRQTRLENKFRTLLLAGIHTTTVEGKEKYQAQKTVKNVSYVYQPLSKVHEGQVKDPTKEEIQAYYKKHKEEQRYHQEPKHKIDYFVLPIQPSHEDTIKAKQYLKKLKVKFASINKDSLFVMRFSQLKRYANDSTSIARPEGAMQRVGVTYPPSIATEMEAAKKGDVVGPYVDRQGAKISKVLRFVPEKTATVRHILLKASSPEEFTAAQKKADSILQVIKKNQNFEAMVQEFSEDPGSVQNGGKYVKFTPGMMVKPFDDFSFNQPIGSMGTVKTSYGIHIVEVLDRGNSKRPILATVVKKIEPTRATIDQAKSLASTYIFELDDKFRSKKTIEQKRAIFDTFAVKNGYRIQHLILRDNSPSIAGNFSNITARKFLRLAYGEGSKVGDLSPSPIRDDGRIIVAYLKDIVEEGAPELKDVQKQMEVQVKQNKKAKYLIDLMVTGGSDLKKLAKEMDVQLESEGITFASRNVQVGNEPKLIGVAFSGLQDGSTSVPVQGKNGVFVLKVNQTTPAQKTDDYSAEINQLNSQIRANIQNKYRNALIEAADVEDNRILRKYGIQ